MSQNQNIYHLSQDIFLLKSSDPEIISSIKNTNKGEDDLLWVEEEAGTLRAVVDLSNEKDVLSYIH